MEREERMQYAREGRQTAAAVKAAGGGQRAVEGAPVSGDLQDAAGSGDRPTYAVAPPPGKEEVQYASMAGD
ncbi:pre-mRNA-splicing factor slt11 [Coccidioides immitis H538.4]|nr:pre-mRNA-splicing factor slt11 [Coccidioides immitis H538.4]